MELESFLDASAGLQLGSRNMIQQEPGAGGYGQANEHEQGDRYLPARMINEAVYCPRLFYLMHVEGQFEQNAETTEGTLRVANSTRLAFTTRVFLWHAARDGTEEHLIAS